MSSELVSFLKKHKIIGLDSMIFIYHFEKYKNFSLKTKLILDNLEKGNFKGVSSVIAILEILTHPKKEKNYYLVKEYKELLVNFPNLYFHDVTLEVADLAASIRAKYNLTAPDAILLASAINAQATGFITSDKKLKQVKEIEVFVLK